MPGKSTNDNIPPGFRLRHILRGHNRQINQIAWSFDGLMLASSSDDYTIRLWQIETGKLFRTLERNMVLGYTIAWSPDGRILASGGVENLILWDTASGQFLRTYQVHSSSINSVAWSPDGKVLASSANNNIILWDLEARTLIGHADTVNSVVWSSGGRILASGSEDTTVRLWSTESGRLLWTLIGHSGTVFSVAWSPDGMILASTSRDSTIRLWNPNSGQQLAVLEGHTNAVTCISFSSDGRLLASKSRDGTVRLWRTDTWKSVAILNEPSSNKLLSNKLLSSKWSSGLAFHPTAPILATLNEEDTVIRIWDLDLTALLSSPSVPPMVRYTNTKAVLVGARGAGKSGLGLVLTDHPFTTGELIHGYHVWIFDNHQIELNSQLRETVTA